MEFLVFVRPTILSIAVTAVSEDDECSKQDKSRAICLDPRRWLRFGGESPNGGKVDLELLKRSPCPWRSIPAPLGRI